MSLTFLDKLKERSLLTYYVLPQYKITLKPEILELITRTYICTNDHTVMIKTSDAVELLSYISPVFSTEIILNGDSCYVKLPKHVNEDDMELLLTGKYSQLSAKFKAAIRMYGCLADFDMRKDGLIYTDALLMALELHPVMRDYMSSVLDVNISENQELLPCLAEDDFVTFQ